LVLTSFSFFCVFLDPIDLVVLLVRASHVSSISIYIKLVSVFASFISIDPSKAAIVLDMAVIDQVIEI